MSAGKLVDFVDDKGFNQLDQVLQKLGLVRNEMIDSIAVTKQYMDAMGGVKNLSDFNVANQNIANSLQGVAEKQAIVTSLQKEATTATVALVEQTKQKILQDVNADSVLKQVGGTLDANIKLLIQQKLELKAVADQQKALSKEVSNSTASQQALNNKTAELTKQSIELKNAIAQNNLVIKQQVKDEQAAISSNDQHIARLNLLRKAYNSLSVDEQKNASIGGVLLSNITQLDEATKKANQTQGKFNDNVGNYENFATKALSGFRQLAYILPGLGMAGIFNLLFEGITKIAQGFELFKSKIEAAGGLLKNFNELNKQASDQYGQESTRLKVLYEAATDVTNSMHNRLLAALELKKEFPNTFENLTKEAILTGNAKKGYDELTDSLLKNAIARASLQKIEQLAAVQAEAEITKQKIENARINETLRVPKLTVARGLNNANSDIVATPKSVLEQQAKDEINARAKISKDKQDQLIKDAQDQIDFFKKLSGGNNKVALEISKDNAKTLNDQSLKSAKELNNDELELQKLKLQGEKETAKLILDDQEQSYAARLAALKVFVDRSNAIIETENEIANRAPGISKTKKAANNQNASNQKAQVKVFDRSETIKIQKDVSNEIKQNFDDLIKYNKGLADEAIAIAQQSSDDQLTILETNKVQEEGILGQKYADGKVSEKEYRRDLLAIQDKYDVDRLQKIKDFEEAKLLILQSKENADISGSLALGGGDDEARAIKGKSGVSQQKNVVAKANNALIGAKGKQTLDGNVQTGKDGEQLIAAEARIGEQLISQAKSYNDARIAIEEARFKKQADLISQQAEADRASVERGVGTSRDKANKIAAINANEASQKKALQEEENKLKHKAAVADKIAAEAAVVINTAVAVTKVTAQAGLLGLLTGVPAVIALGAIQAAAIAGAPIAAFEHGGTTKNDAPILTGEAGPELRIDPSGKYSFTEGRPNITFAKKGTQIISNKELVKMLGRPEPIQYVGGQAIDISKVVEAQRETTKAIKGIQHTQNRRGINKSAGWDNYLQRNGISN